MVVQNAAIDSAYTVAHTPDFQSNPSLGLSMSNLHPLSIGRHAPRNGRSGTHKGFALVVTLALMILLTVIAVGLLSLSSITLRSTSAERNIAVARANARLALMIALGELQKNAGPDRRVTASSGVMDANSATPHVLGVWNSWGEGIENGSDLTESNVKDSYGVGRQPRFRTWLMPGTQAGVFALSQPLASEPTVRLVGEGSLGQGAETKSFVDMPLVAVFDQGRKRGAYSWWITEENSKARVNLYKELPKDKSAMTLEAAAAPTFAVAGIDQLETLAQDDSVLRAITYGTLELLGKNNSKLPESAKARFHDVTVDSVGLLTNTKSGGMRKDLNLLAELNTLPSELTAGPNKPLEIFPGASGGDPGPRWDQLRAFCRSYKPFADGGSVKWVGGIPNFDPGKNWLELVSRRDWMRNLPVATKWQWLLSHYSEKVALKAGETAADQKYQIRLVMDSIMELWNPWNLPMTAPTDCHVQFKTLNMPYGVGYFINGVKWPSSDTGSLTSKSLYWMVKDQVPGGSAAGIGTGNLALTDPLNAPLKAGEVKVFSGSPGSAPQRVTNLQVGMQLQPDWNYGGGRYVDSLGHGDRKLEVKGGDIIKVRFDSAKGTQSFNGFDHLMQMWVGGPGGWGADDDPNRQFGRAGAVSTKNSLADVAPSFPNDPIEFGAAAVEGTKNKRPFALIGMRMRTERRIEPQASSPVSASEKAYSKHMLYSDPWGNSNAVTDGNKLMLRHNSYEFFAQRVGSISDYPLVEISPNNQGYQGTSRGAGTPLNGQNFMAVREVPFQPLISMGQLQHAGLGHPMPDSNYVVKPTDPYVPYLGFPYVANALGNSWALPFIDGSKTQEQAMAPDSGTVKWLYDKSWKTNDKLWDDWFFSSISPQTHELIASGDRKSMKEILTGGVKGEFALPNSRYRFADTKQGAAADALVQELEAADGYKKISAFLVCDGAFNVNSTSVEAWKAFLASLNGRSMAWLDSATGTIDSAVQEYPVSRFTLPNAAGAKTGEFTGNQTEFLRKRWEGVRSLTKKEIEELANKIVIEVRERGPFLSLGEFVNRRLETGENGLKGALQDAIDQTSINDSFKTTSMPITAGDIADVGYKNAKAAEGLNGEGAPGYVTQADFLMPLAPLVTVRSDTFCIRSYGESVNANGDVLARAYCEAVVQRVPDYVDGGDKPEKEVLDKSNKNQLSKVNQAFGRRFKIKSFRWLSPSEV